MSSWKEIISQEMKKDYYKQIVDFLHEDVKKYEIYPNKQDIFNAFKLCPLDKTKVVLLGQDCYHNPLQAHGLAFSVRQNITAPPSLKNIFKELKEDLNIKPPNHGCLESWAKQDVLLLNSALTVRRNQPGSHLKIWQPFTDKIIRVLNDNKQPIVFVLWGSFAKSKKEFITNPKHLILESGHPSPFSCHLFFGGRYFSKCNEFLIKNGIEPIDWKIQNI